MFVPTTKALNELNLNISRQHLYHLIKSGELENGKHYIDVRSPNSKRPTYRVCVSELQNYFEVR
jgi:hypothetical protein